METIKVLIVDDSAVVRQVLSAVLEDDPEIDLMHAASDPLFAMERMRKQWPDVIVLDVEMPRMDGITFLKKIMAERPTPVVICSTLTEKNAATTVQALEAGAFGIITKPKLGLKQFLEEFSVELSGIIKAAANANARKLVPTGPVATFFAPPESPVCATPSLAATVAVNVPEIAPANGAMPTEPRKAPAAKPSQPPKFSADVILSAATHTMAENTEQIVAIGTSTGGTQALEAVLTALPETCPGIVVVQHMPEKFTSAFASRLNGLCQIEVREARSGDQVLPGLALIAPGGKHMLLKRGGGQYHVEIVDGPPVSRHRPSVDVLFRSVAKSAGKNALGIIMTGMGDDGAVGLLEMRNHGAQTIGQDENSCVVFGMPKEADKRGAVGKLIPLGDIASEIAGLSR